MTTGCKWQKYVGDKPQTTNILRCLRLKTLKRIHTVRNHKKTKIIFHHLKTLIIQCDSSPASVSG